MRAASDHNNSRMFFQTAKREAEHDEFSDDTRRRSTKRKINPLSPPTTVNIRGIDVHFPFKPYDVQMDYMNTVMDSLLRSENALLESPTGTGKTLCLLCTALGWQREQLRLLNAGHSDLLNPGQTTITSRETSSSTMMESGIATPPLFPTIIYASRTHSQLSQVIRELRTTQYRPRHAVLGSREQMCVHPKVKSANATSYEINHNCNKLCKERNCSYRNNLEGFSMPLSSTESRGSPSGIHLQPVMDMEELVAMGKKSKVCAFYFTRGLVDKAELILLPYNYLFDKDARATTLAEIPWNNAVLIFDEAHNLEAFASDSASFEFSSADIAGCVSEVQKAINYVQAMPEIAISLKLENLIKLKALFLQMEDFIMSLSAHQSAYSGEFIIEIFRRGASITHANHEIFVDEVKRVSDFVMDARGSTGTGSRGLPRLEHFSQCVKRVFGNTLESRCLAKAAFYRVHVTPKTLTSTVNGSSKHHSATTLNTGRTVSYWCFAPSVAMEELSSLNVRSILVTSGTLSPLPSYSMELGLHFPQILENPHIIEDNQIHVRIFASGPTGKLLNSSYDRRQDKEYYQELGNAILELARVTPEGMLIFFPSYNVMETCVERWGGPCYRKSQEVQSSFFAARRKQTASSSRYSFPQAPHFLNNCNGMNRTIWQELVATKAIVLEPKTSAELPQALAEYEKYLALEKSAGSIMMGVCRGKISEGIDFANEQSRSVIITGLPFPPAMDPKVRMKRDYLDRIKAAAQSNSLCDSGFHTNKAVATTQNKLSGNEWYTQQAHRAVNQAIGRVIRNRSDYGAVLLLDSRFSQPNNQAGLSKWIRPHVQADECFETSIRCLKEFFQSAKAITAEQSEGAIVRNELDLETVNYEPTQLVVVKRSNNEHESKNEASKSAYVSEKDVVSRLKVADLKTLELQSRCHRKEASPETLASSSNDAVFHHNPAVQKLSKVAPSSESMELAVQFMTKAKANLSPSALSKIRKAIVAMKRFGENSQHERYLQSASDIVGVILQCDQIELVNSVDDKGILFLFFELLPAKYKKEIELMAFEKLFSCSSLARLYDNCSARDSFVSLKSNVASLLHSLWCTDCTNRFKKEKLFHDIREIFLTHEMSGTGRYDTMIQSLCKLLPPTFDMLSRTLLNDMVASRNIKIMRSSDKARSGDNVLDVTRFHSLNTPIFNGKGQNSKLPGKQDYTKHDVDSNQCNSSPIKTSAKGQYSTNRVSMSPKLGNDNGSQVPVTKPSLSSVLKAMETETYLMKKLDVETKFQSVDVECPVCNEVITEPCAAPCGHMACFQCWSKWLKRGAVCITCRLPVTPESLSRVVYEQNPRSLSKVAPNHDSVQPGTSEGESDNEELEILR